MLIEIQKADIKIINKTPFKAGVWQKKREIQRGV